MVVVDAMTSEEPVHLNGEGRFDSPGHSALFGTYTMMDSKANLIVACQLVKVLVCVHEIASECLGQQWHCFQTEY